MQNLIDLPLTMSAKKPMFLSNQKLCQLFLLYCLLDLLDNPTTFQLNWIRTQNFQSKLFDIVVTLKYGQGH